MSGYTWGDKKLEGILRHYWDCFEIVGTRDVGGVIILRSCSNKQIVLEIYALSVILEIYAFRYGESMGG